MEFQVRILGVGLTFFVYLFQIFIDEISSETFNSPFYRTTIVLTNSAAFYTQVTAILADPIRALARILPSVLQNHAPLSPCHTFPY